MSAHSDSIDDDAEGFDVSMPLPLELEESNVSWSAWLLFIGNLLSMIGLLELIRENLLASIALMMFGGVFGFIGFFAVFYSLRVERVKLAVHMLRSISMHAELALKKGNMDALRLIDEAWRRERGFVTRMLRLVGINPEQVFAERVINGVARFRAPVILVHSDGMLDLPATFTANVMGSAMASVMALFGFIVLGFIFNTVALLISPIVIYLTGRALRKHAERENKIRSLLGLPPVPSSAPRAAWILLSILTGGLLLPVFAKKLANSIDSHVLSH